MYAAGDDPPAAGRARLRGVRAFSRRRVLGAVIAVAALSALGAFVVVMRHIENDVPAADDELFDVVAPRRGEIRRAASLLLRFQTGTCFRGATKTLRGRSTLRCAS